MKVLTLLLLFIISGCTTLSNTPHHALEDLAAIPFATMVALDRPGHYGNWWRKVPLENEKKYFERSHKGAVAPDLKYRKDDFVGWHGIVLSCKKNKSGFRLNLDHRHAGYHNVMYGVADSSSVYSVSLFGEGEFQAVHTVKQQSTACPNNWLPGDLLKVYGERIADKEVSIHFIRHWPRSTYELSPEVPQRSEGNYLYEDMSGEQWVKVRHDKKIRSRRMKIDKKVKKSLIPYLQSSDESIKAQAIYNFGEVGRPEDGDYLKKVVGESPSDKIKKVSTFALKRLNQESGPWWNVEKPKPYWGQK